MRFAWLLMWALTPVALGGAEPAVLEFPARSRAASENGVTVSVEATRWPAAETALIICDFWDSHHCARAVQRVNEMAPRLAEVVAEARRRGVFVIHAPSDCMAAYEGHPARQRAQQAPTAANQPKDITRWLDWKNEEEKQAGYPIDASDGGEDDTPEEHAAWRETLKAMGRNPAAPWQRQHAAVVIDAERDAISDHGDEIWNLLEARRIRNVLLVGVHANMCVCGRPFGLRQLSRNGKNAVLLRDLTDAMYNPAKPPFVGHFRGTELMVGHIERFIGPSALSGDVFGGASFTFSGDSRPHLAVMIGEDEYHTWETLPAFAERELGKEYRLSYIIEAEAKSGRFAQIEALSSADGLLLSCRRRALLTTQLDDVKNYVASGRPLIGIRTASHAFAPGSIAASDGRAAWPEFDRTVLGGNYHGHSGNEAKTFARPVGARESEAPAESLRDRRQILTGISPDEFPTGGSLYLNVPLERGTGVVMEGRAEGLADPQPVAWTHASPSGGRVFYTSLGHPDDFKRPEFLRLLANAVRWAAPPSAGGR